VFSNEPAATGAARTANRVRGAVCAVSGEVWTTKNQNRCGLSRNQKCKAGEEMVRQQARQCQREKCSGVTERMQAW